MKRQRGSGYKGVLALLMVIGIAGMLTMNGAKAEKSVRKVYKTDSGAGNPLMGYAPNAWLDPEDMREDIHLLYVDITWREWEPEKGEYAVEAIRTRNQLAHWRHEGKHLVLRFVCDVPGDEDHLDIPDWLYDETDGAGTHYDIEYGKGFSPDYNNELFIEYHKQAVLALGEAFGQDTFVSYVQLGSLGHWGEWHVDYKKGIDRLPEADIRQRYIEPYMEAFPHAYILMRRSFEAAQKYGFGLYNDRTGHARSTQEWLSWIEEGGEYDQTREKEALVPMPEYWKKAPSGGEFTSSLSMKNMLSQNTSRTKKLIRNAHVTFLGPKIADGRYASAYRQMLRNMGYRLYISEARLTEEEQGTRLTMVWENQGVAPMYFEWPVYACVFDQSGELLERVEVPICLRELLPDTEVECEVMLETMGIAQRGYGNCRICIGIMDPMTGEYAVRLDMKAKRFNGMTILFD